MSASGSPGASVALSGAGVAGSAGVGLGLTGVGSASVGLGLAGVGSAGVVIGLAGVGLADVGAGLAGAVSHAMDAMERIISTPASRAIMAVSLALISSVLRSGLLSGPSWTMTKSGRAVFPPVHHPMSRSGGRVYGRRALHQARHVRVDPEVRASPEDVDVQIEQARRVDDLARPCVGYRRLHGRDFAVQQGNVPDCVQPCDGSTTAPPSIRRPYMGVRPHWSFPPRTAGAASTPEFGKLSGYYYLPFPMATRPTDGTAHG